MSVRFAVSLFAALAFAAGATAGPAQGFAQLDPIWSVAPVRGAEAPVLGNGLLSASVWLGAGGGFNWELHRRDLPLALGNCNLQAFGGYETGDAKLDLWNAELHGSVTGEHGAVRYHSFICANPSVLVIQLGGIRPATGLLVWLPSKHSPVPSLVTTSGEVASVETTGANGAALAVVLRRIESRPEQKVYAVAVEPGATSAAALAAATGDVERASSLGFRALLAVHRAQWHGAYRANAPMTPADQAFWLQRYKALSLGTTP
ncbi:MAG TPA: hypothetical protein VGL42_11970 [Opitutaceae bacterium]|jgi:hypothetical protein